MRAYCPICEKLVPAAYVTTELGLVELVKSCPEHGTKWVTVEIDADMAQFLENAPRTHEQDNCYIVDVTGRCQAGCEYCYSSMGPDRLVKEILDEVHTLPGHCRVLLSGGEPTLHPNLDEIVNLVATSKRHPVLLTNGALLTPTRLKDLIYNGLQVIGGVPQVAVSLQLPGYCTTHQAAFDNLRQTLVESVAFTVDSLEDVDHALEIANQLRHNAQSFCLRTAWGSPHPVPFVSDIVKATGGELIDAPSPYGFRSAMVNCDGLKVKIISWPNLDQYDTLRYCNRGVWYKGRNVVDTILHAKNWLTSKFTCEIPQARL